MQRFPSWTLTLPAVLLACQAAALPASSAPLDNKTAAADQKAEETAAQAAARHERVASRRAQVMVICHRGASEFAHENTLEAYRAALELGADGNEIDIRRTRDGVLVCFHDDMLDHLLDAFGDVGDYDWSELATFRFRRPGWLGDQCRIPTLAEVFSLHRDRAGLMHLDIKRPGLEPAIRELLDRMDLWDHVMAINEENGKELLADPRCRAVRYRASLYGDRKEVFPQAIAEGLKGLGDGVIVDDPRGVLVALDRSLGKPSREPVAPRDRPERKLPAPRSEEQLLAILADRADWKQIPTTPEGREAKARQIVAQAEAAEEVRRRRMTSPALLSGLALRVRHRSLHPEWMYNGLDGGAALRALLELNAPGAVDLARECLWRDDPAVEPTLDLKWNVPRSWGDFRTKAIVFDWLANAPGPAAAKLCRDYLALLDDESRRIGPPQFESAARALLALSPDEATALELLKHRRSDVRGRTIFECLKKSDQPWARRALETAAPDALAYLPGG